MVQYVQAVIGKKKFLVKFQYGKKSEMISCLIFYACLKEEVGQELDKPISKFPPKLQGEFLTIDGDTVCEGYYMSSRFMYLYVFYCLCFVNEISTYTFEENVT